MASSFKSDAAGFLVGELVQSNRDLHNAQEASYQTLRALRTDVRAIGRQLGAQMHRAQRDSRAASASARAPSAPAPRGTRTAGGNYIATPVGRGSARPVRSSAAAGQRTTASATSPVRRAPAAVATPTGRDDRGRFIARAKAGRGSAKSDKADDSGGSTSSFGSAVRGLTGAVRGLRGTLASADNVDPTLNAAKEIADVVSPLGRGMASMFGRSAERKKERWYQRILKALTAKKPDSPAQARAGGGFFSLGGGAAAGGLGGAAGGLLGGLLGKGGSLLKGGGRLLRRVPLLGALLAGGSALASMFTDDNPALSPDQNRTARYRGVGEAGGMLAGGMAGASLGAAIGTAILPGVGTAIGGFLGGVGGALLGEQFGAKVGDWTKTLIDADIGGKAVAAWNITTAAIGAAWDSFTADAKVAWSGVTAKVDQWWESTKSAAASISASVSGAAAGANDWVKAKTGVDMKGAVSSAWDATKSAAGGAWSAAKGYAGDAGASLLSGAQTVGSALVPNTVKRAVAAGSAAATQAKAGYDVERSGSTNAGAPAGPLQEGARAAGGAVGSGINKVLQTGAGYNVTQNADGSVTRQEGARNWRNNNPGNIEAGDFANKHGAIGSDGRFAIFPDYATGRAAKEALIFEGRNYKDKSLTDAISRYAPPSENNTAGYQSAVLGAVGGANKKMSDYTPSERGAIMDAMQKVEGYKAGRSSVITAASMPAIPSAATALSSLPSVSVPPSIPVNIPAAPDASKLPQRLAGAGDRQPVVVRVAEPVGQGVADRGLAHIASGGIGS